jgi:hypothetical protein
MAHGWPTVCTKDRLTSHGSWVDCTIRLRCLQKFGDVHTRCWPSYESLSEHRCVCLVLIETQAFARAMTCMFALIRKHVITRVMAFTWGSDSSLGCSKGTDLDCYRVRTTSNNFGMTIITLGCLHYVLSCQPTCPEALSTPHGRRADSEVSGILVGSYVLWRHGHQGI